MTSREERGVPEHIDCEMCADSGLMSVLSADLKMEIWPCLCPRGRERDNQQDEPKDDNPHPHEGND